MSKVHKNKFRHGWFTKLCDPTLYVEVNVSQYWKHVTCLRCLAKKPKARKRK